MRMKVVYLVALSLPKDQELLDEKLEQRLMGENSHRLY